MERPGDVNYWSSIRLSKLQRLVFGKTMLDVFLKSNTVVTQLTLFPATGRGLKYPQYSFIQKSPSQQFHKTVYLLPVLRGRSGCNVHETCFATTSNECP